MSRVPMTIKGAESLRKELQELKMVVRPRITKAIAEARAHGDLKENAEYHAAREQQSFAEGRVKDIEGKLSDAQIIDTSSMDNNGKVIFGARVEIINCDTDAVKSYQIVGEDEANIKENRISYTSPIAKALIGKNEGEEVCVQTPGGAVDYEIAKVEYE
ncbi:MAG: transcription elongation factor GreA [Gammaproteobacteria bacterium]|nr:MAG: transcription elongation factor GreA [Gammaproteobacteria bacterium]